MNITIDPEFASLLAPHTAQELEELRQSLKSEGQRDQLVVWQTENALILIDGHTRLPILRELNIPPRAIPRKFASRDEAKTWILSNQLSRRNLTDDQRKIAAAVLYDLRSAHSKSEKGKHARSVALDEPVGPLGLGVTPAQNQAESVRTQVAREAGFTEKQLRPAIELVQKRPDLAAQVKTGELKLKDARQELKTDSVTPIPEGITAQEPPMNTTAAEPVVSTPVKGRGASEYLDRIVKGFANPNALSGDVLKDHLTDKTARLKADNVRLVKEFANKKLPQKIRSSMKAQIVRNNAELTKMNVPPDPIPGEIMKPTGNETGEIKSLIRSLESTRTSYQKRLDSITYQKTNEWSADERALLRQRLSALTKLFSDTESLLQS